MSTGGNTVNTNIVLCLNYISNMCVCLHRYSCYVIMRFILLVNDIHDCGPEKDNSLTLECKQDAQMSGP